MIIIRPAKKQESSEIASLIMEAMNPDCCKWFYGPDHTDIDFHEFMTSLVEADNTQYSYLNTIVAFDTDEDNLAGMLVSYDGAMLHKLRTPFLEGMKSIFNRDLTLDDETQEGELYLDSLCVKKMYRRLGIATRLLKAGIEKTAQMGLPYTGLLVDHGNPKAEKLYASLGFTVANEKSWGSHPMHHMVRKATPISQAAHDEN